MKAPITAGRRQIGTSRSEGRSPGSSWPGLSGPTIAARAGGDWLNKVGHDGEKAQPIRPNLPAICCSLLLVGLMAGPAWGQAADRPDLTVCLQTNDPPLSFRNGDKPDGFDVALTRTIAERLGREVRLQWFVSRDDPDSNLTKDSNALLSDGRCQLVAEYPLTAGTLAHPHSPTGKLPPFDGARPDDRKRWVKLGDLM